ncbi:MAG: NADH-quinone oxidoreductase subunit L [Bilifractor sp.]
MHKEIIGILVPFLIIFPMIIGAVAYFIRVNPVRRIIASISVLVMMAATALLVILWFAGGAQPLEMYYETELADRCILAGELALMAIVTILCCKYRKFWIAPLSIVPTLMIAYTELTQPMRTISHIYIDHLTILMCIIIGLIGGLIVIYAIGYMHGYQHHHTEVLDRRNYFFMVIFLFLGAMYGFVLSDSLIWIDLFWEITSVCSFLLIGYTRTPEAVTNSFRALWMNLLGGTLLAIGIVYYGSQSGDMSFHGMIQNGTAGIVYAVIPIAFMAFAALTKAAQMPFSTWLMGAMVAPTPSSALLHSATMVKAGIYILFRLAPAMSGTTTGNMIALVGGFTFFTASVMAIAQTDAKKILAFSTISNLGLMVACAGVGRAETLWAGIFLMIFHSISKSLMFQDVGATENAIHTRDVEQFHGLLYRLPYLASLQFIGIAGMFLAPFGMLVSKWSALKASVDGGQVLLVFFIIFGSATTSFYWTKWMGKLIMHTSSPQIMDVTTKNSEKISMTIHAFLMVALCILFPLLTGSFVDPLVVEEYGSYKDVLPIGLLFTLILVIVLIFAVPFIAFRITGKNATNHKLSYMNGINVNNHQFTDSYGNAKRLYMSNYYFAHTIGQRKLMVPCQLFSTAVLIVMLCMIVGGAA